MDTYMCFENERAAMSTSVRVMQVLATGSEKFGKSRGGATAPCMECPPWREGFTRGVHKDPGVHK